MSNQAGVSPRIMTIVGARPQFIKAAPVSRALARHGIDEILVHTGQHHDDNMSSVFFSELDIPAPRHNLEIHGGGHGQMTGRMLEALEAVVAAEAPQGILIYGDTNSTLAGALTGAKMHIPVLHVEAGLRSYNRRMPEEVNRVVADHLSHLLLCPSRQSVANLAAEGLTAGVHHVGDVMYDATLYAKEAAESRSSIVEKLGLQEGAYGLCTVHRAENTDDPVRLAAIIAYVEEAARSMPIVWPLHPRTRSVFERLGLSPKGMLFIDPLGYMDLHRLLATAASVFTDSGGLQKEAYFHRTPCVTLRDETEWVETVDAGWNRLWTTPEYAPRRDIPDYGVGDASERIAKLVKTEL